MYCRGYEARDLKAIFMLSSATCRLLSPAFCLFPSSLPFFFPIFRILIFRRKSFSKHIDQETGYWYYENDATGERHWDRPLDGVAALQPKSPRPGEKLVDAA